MRVLRLFLTLQAAAGGTVGVALTLFPRPLADALGLELPGEAAWMRLVGIQSIVLSLLLVLLSRRLDELWWWSWAFVLGDLAAATLSVLKAALGATPGSTLAWWLFGGAHAALGAGLLVGISRAGGAAARGEPGT